MVAGSTGACGLTATSCRGKRGTLLRWRRRYAVGMRTRQRSGSPVTLGIGVGWGGGTHSAPDRVQALSSTCPLYTDSHACAGAGRARGGAGRAAAQAPRPAARACARSAPRTLHAHARRARALRGGLCVPAKAAAGVLHSCEGSRPGARRLGGRRADAPHHSPRPLVLVLLTTMTLFNGRTTVVSTMSESGNSTSSLSRSGLVRGALPAHKLDPYMRQPTPLGSRTVMTLIFRHPASQIREISLEPLVRSALMRLLMAREQRDRETHMIETPLARGCQGATRKRHWIPVSGSNNDVCLVCGFLLVCVTCECVSPAVLT